MLHSRADREIIAPPKPPRRRPPKGPPRPPGDDPPEDWRPWQTFVVQGEWSDYDGPTRPADLLRRAPGGQLFAYLKARHKGQLLYHVYLVKMTAWQMKAKLEHETHKFDTIRFQTQEHLGVVIKYGNTFFACTKGRCQKRGRGSKTLKAASQHLYRWSRDVA